MQFTDTILIVFGLGAILSYMKEIKKWPLVEPFQFLMTICAAFIGLYTTFNLNADKQKSDKNGHLVSILNTIQDKQTSFVVRVRYSNLLVTDSSKRAVVLNVLKSGDFPFLTDINDPVIYEMSSYSLVEINNLETNLKQLFNSIKENNSVIKEKIIAIRFLAWAISNQMDMERQCLTKEINDSTFTVMSHAFGDTLHARFARSWIPPERINF
jgi:hypothetical protein